MVNYDDFSYAVKVFNPNNRVILDDRGNPSVMVGIPKTNATDVITGAASRTLPSHIVNAVERDMMYIGKYQAIVRDSRAYSLPGEDPANTINFDASLAACRAKGAGWGLTPFSLWATIALLCKANGFQPNGNNNYGADISAPWEKGEPAIKETSGAFRTLRTKTGSGPKSWYHNNDMSGIADLCGNVWEWLAGMRTLSGEINIIPNADVMLADVLLTAASNFWQALDENGNYIAPGTAGSLKFDGVNPIKVVKTQTATTAQSSRLFGQIAAGADVAAIPQILQELALVPADTTVESYNGDAVWINYTDERLPYRGGSWIYGVRAGVFALSLNNARSLVDSYIGFRPAFCDL
ncbi:hypothetical protein FACS18949_02920 [Clostridia bacterium]|nr:hypothetical protein FACS18949_02920 [Clostridia bacterium]